MKSFNSVSAKGTVVFNDSAYNTLADFLTEKKPGKTFVVVDTNTHEFCLPRFLSQVYGLQDSEIIEIDPGEAHKNIETCMGLWSVLSELGADRNSLVINLGGGVISDIGGFIASTYMRGISYINVPTSLLGMVDAAIGGKNGVSLGNLKNQIGVVNPAEFVMIDLQFLQSLPQKEFRSGLAEVLKHGLIHDEKYWGKSKSISNFTSDQLEEVVRESVAIKDSIVNNDPKEKGLRKTLNFGHTIGHAIESFHLENSGTEKILHGEAVAAGMVMACYISTETEGFPKEKLKDVTEVVLSIFGKIPLEKEDDKKILEIMKFDKKNSNGKINFVLLKNIGSPVIDCNVSKQIIFDAFDYYRKA